MASAEDRYRTLLDMSSTLADQPTVKAMVHTLRGLLSSTCSVHGAHLYILDSEGDRFYLFEFDQAPDAPLSRPASQFRAVEHQQESSTNKNRFSSRLIAGTVENS